MADSGIPTVEENAGHDDELQHEIDCAIDGENDCTTAQSPQSSAEYGGRSFVVKAPRADSKLILQNMEEVLNSVKKKHRQKHRRKKEQKKLAMMAEAAHEKVEDAEEVAVNLNTSDFGEVKSKKITTKKPLQEQQAHMTEAIGIPNGKRKQSARKRRKRSICADSLPMAIELNMNATRNDDLEQAVTPKSSTITKKNATNAFEVMMNARNKTIGSNTPGKEVNVTEAPAGNNGAGVNAQRKQLLQSWADRKGGLKRKLDEEMRAAYVEDRLYKRAKRLKKMLTTAGSPSSGATSVRSNSPDRPEPKQKEPTNSSMKNKSETRKKTLGRRSRRLSSTDSLELNNDRKSSLDDETDEFLSKLSSPTKKRDSLLGYFSKIPSPNGSVATSTPDLSTKPAEKHRKNSTATPTKRQSRRSRASMNVKKAEIEEETPPNSNGRLQVKNDQNQSPVLRPKRACVEKARYDYDLEADESLKKVLKTDDCIETDSRDQQRRSSKRKSKYDSKLVTVTAKDESILVIDLDSTGPSSLNGTIELKTPKKLAPLFMRSLPKPNLDAEVLKARQEFLRSGVPDKLKLEQDKQKQYEQSYEEAIELFPKISHRQQWSNDEVEFLTHNLMENSELNFRFEHSEETFLSLNDSSTEIGTSKSRSNAHSRKSKTTKLRASLLGITNCILRDFRQGSNNKLKSHDRNTVHAENGCLPIVKNKRLIIKAWKVDFDRFPTYKCYNQLRTKYHFFSALDSAQDTEQLTESFVVTRSTRRSVEATQSNRRDSCSEEDIKPPAMAPNGELLFTEKYKPMLFEQVLVNMMPVSQLREFLANWANGNGGGGNGNCARNSQNGLDDSMDFLNDSNSSQQTISNSVVLLGPASSGKTNAVFTLANEMNFNVLEINAGMKRTGKKLIQELLEATQSHQIRNEPTGGSAVKSKAQKNLLKMSLNSLKSRINDGETASSVTADLSSRKCLILIEDADIVFEQADAGFTDAVYTLAASSKRPVIIVATNPNCQHLQRLMVQNTIKFTAPNALNVSKYLAVLSLMENCPVSLDDLISLYLYNRHDLRKTLHELQFFIQSGGDRERQIANGTQNINESKELNKNSENTSTNDKATTTGKYFASPIKSERRESQEEDTQSQDEQLKRDNTNKQQQQQQPQHEQQKQQQSAAEAANQEELYVHRTLFEFYTVDQNSKWRIPFPVNFDLFYCNLRDIFSASKMLCPSHKEIGDRVKREETCRVVAAAAAAAADDDAAASSSTKRKSRSPKKLWLSNATATVQVDVAAAENYRNSQSYDSLGALSNFYNNVSIASLVATCNQNVSCTSSMPTRYEQDRLKPYLSESIAHDILEIAMNVNLEAELCPYNLFEERRKSNSLIDLMGSTMTMLPKRVRCAEFEPVLRSICRSEQQRAAQERRSTRFYHYLRNSCGDMCNWSQKPFDVACSTFQEDERGVQKQIKCD